MAKTKTEKLLKAIERKGSMSRKDMVSFLLKLNDRVYHSLDNRDTYNALLYGTTHRKGILERFCKADRSGTYPVYYIRKAYSAPFTVAR